MESGARVGEASRTGELRGLVGPELIDVVSSGPVMLARRASWRDRLRMMSDFIEIARVEPCSL